MKIKDFNAVKFFSKKFGKEFNSSTTYGEISLYKKVKEMLPYSNIVVFPRKYLK